MSYVSKEWVTGETITADGLNNIEEGIQEALDCCGGGGDSGVFIVKFTQTSETTATADKTLAEITEAYEAGKFIKGFALNFNNTGWIELETMIASQGGMTMVQFVQPLEMEDNDQVVTLGQSSFVYTPQGIQIHNMELHVPKAT